MRFPDSSARSDLFLVIAGATGVFLLASSFELSEHLLALSRPFEFAQLDELAFGLLALSLGLLWFSWRRWREGQRELRDRMASEQALAESREQLRQLAWQNVTQLERERRELAHELHDELGQILNAIKLDAVMIRDGATPVSPVSVRGGTQRVGQSIIELADQSYATVRRIIGRLRPVGIEEMGLATAVEHLLHTWRQRLPTLDITFDAMFEDREIDALKALAAYRIVQEAMNNIVRHADARLVRVSLEWAENKLVIQISDDGCGFDPAVRSRQGLGLLGMRERAEALGGQLEIISSPGRGCSIRGVLPLA